MEDGGIQNGGRSPTIEDGPFLVNTESLKKAADGLLDLLVDEFVVASATQIGREFRYGELEELGLLDSVTDEYKVNTTPGLDIFGQPMSKNAKANFECECPKCNRTLAAARFAQHLEKCMGMGRNSSRIARRRLAASSTTGGSSGASNGNGHGGPTTGSLDKNSSQASGAAGSNASNADLDLGSEEEHFSEDDDEEWTMERKKKTKKAAPKKTANSEGQ